MRVIAKNKAGSILRLETGEELMGELAAFARKRKIGGAWFSAIGAADEIEIAFYDLKRKKYVSRRFRGRLEIINITGNIAKKGKEFAIHAHGIFSTPGYAAIGGHIISCRISATCEIYLTPFKPLRRTHDPKTGLNLLVHGRQK